MSKIISFIFAIIFLLNPDVFASEYKTYNDYNLQNFQLASDNIKKIQSQEENEHLESPLRRFEITFFVSLPFIFLSNFLILHISDVFIEKDPNVNVWENHGLFLALNTLMLTSIVAYREANIISDLNKKKENNVKEMELNISFSRNF